MAWLGKHEKLGKDPPQIRSMGNAAPTTRTRKLRECHCRCRREAELWCDDGFATGRGKGGGCEGASVSGGRSQEGLHSNPNPEGVNLF